MKFFIVSRHIKHDMLGHKVPAAQVEVWHHFLKTLRRLLHLMSFGGGNFQSRELWTVNTKVQAVFGERSLNEMVLCLF